MMNGGNDHKELRNRARLVTEKLRLDSVLRHTKKFGLFFTDQFLCAKNYTPAPRVMLPVELSITYQLNLDAATLVQSIVFGEFIIFL